MLRKLIHQAYNKGWVSSADWAGRDDLCADLDSPIVNANRNNIVGEALSKLPTTVLTNAELNTALLQWNQMEVPEGLGLVDRMVYGAMRAVERAVLDKLAER